MGNIDSLHILSLYLNVTNANMTQRNPSSNHCLLDGTIDRVFFLEIRGEKGSSENVAGTRYLKSAGRSTRVPMHFSSMTKHLYRTTPVRNNEHLESCYIVQLREQSKFLAIDKYAGCKCYALFTGFYLRCDT